MNDPNETTLQPLHAALPANLGRPNSEPVKSSTCPPSVAAERATIMLGCYRRGDVADSEIFTRGVISILCEYPERVVRLITDPARGLPGRVQWLPTLAEIRAACEAEHAPTVRAQERERRRLEQWRERLAPPAVTEEGRARALAHWERRKAEMTGETVEDKQRSLVEAEKRLADAQLGRLPRTVASEELLAKIRSRETEDAA